CQIYAVYTQKRDVTRRLEQILLNEGIRVAVLTTDVPPEAREAWYERQLRSGVQAVICHPKLVQTGLDLIDFPTILFYETGYSIYVLRQASRRSWRIGQRLPVKVKYLHYAETMQESCLRLMGKKLLVSLAIEGKFSSEGLQAINDEDDILMAMARELVTEKGIGERADAVWATLQKKQEEVFAVKSTGAEALNQILSKMAPRLLRTRSRRPLNGCPWEPVRNRFVARPRDAMAPWKANSPCSESGHLILPANLH